MPNCTEYLHSCNCKTPFAALCLMHGWAHTDLLCTSSVALRNGSQSSLSLEASQCALADTARQLVPISTCITVGSIVADIALACA